MNKSTILFTLLFLLSAIIGFAQAPPEAFTYSSVIRGNNGQALPNKSVAFRFSILSGSSTGTVVYQETQTKTTDQWGVVSLSIGMGTPTQGTFASINWAGNTHYLKIELDDNAGTNFQTMGTVQFLSVPYALHSKTAESVTNYSEIDPVFDVSVAKGITMEDTARWNTNSGLQWGSLNNNLYYNTGKIGIGTTTPRSFLDVVSNEGSSKYSFNASNH